MKRRCENCIFAVYDYGDGNIMCRIFGLVSHEEAENCYAFKTHEDIKEIEELSTKIKKEAWRKIKEKVLGDDGH